MARGRTGGAPERPSLSTVARQWGRLGCIGFGGPPTHISLLRELCVERPRVDDGERVRGRHRRGNVLPGPASTQLAIYCAWRWWESAAPWSGHRVIVPGLAIILGLASVFLAAAPPTSVLAAAAGVGAAVAAVAVSAGVGLLPASWHRLSEPHWRWIVYARVGGSAAASVGPWFVLVLLGCGFAEMGWRRLRRDPHLGMHLVPVALAAVMPATGGLFALAWVAVKVGALSYGGGFVIVPLMQAGAVDRYHWMTTASSSAWSHSARSHPGPLSKRWR